MVDRERLNSFGSDEGDGGEARKRLQRGVSQYLDPYSSSTDSHACGGRNFAGRGVSQFLDPVGDTDPEEDAETEPAEEQKASDAPPPPEKAPGDAGSVESARSGRVLTSSDPTRSDRRSGYAPLPRRRSVPSKAPARCTPD